MNIFNERVELINKFDEDKARSYLKNNTSIFNTLNSHELLADGNFPPELIDLARLHALLIQGKVMSVLEYGVGFSTLIFADALRSNKNNFGVEASELRKNNKFNCHSFDTNNSWIKKWKNILSEFGEYVSLYQSSVSPNYFNGRLCHTYNMYPNIMPDFIYLDGPDPSEVVSNDESIWMNSDYPVMAGDLLFIENLLLPGTEVIVDGRTLNARFLEQNFQRNWKIYHSDKCDISYFFLDEPPIGSYNKKYLDFRFSLIN